MKVLFSFCVFLLIISGCRKESPLEAEELIPNNNLSSAITILSPLDSDEYTYGEEVLIKWQPVNANVNIELFRKTEYKFEIASNVNRQGEYIWIVPDNLPGSAHYRIKLILRENPDNTVYSEEFTIKGY